MDRSILINSIFVFIYLVILQMSCVDKDSSSDCEVSSYDESLIEEVNFYEVDDLNFAVFDSDLGYYYNKTYDPGTYIDSFYAPWEYKPETNPQLVNEIWQEFFTFDTGIAAGRDSDGQLIPNGSPCYAGNLRMYSEKYIKELKANLPSRTYDFLNKTGYGITIETTDLKGLPSDEFCLKRIRNSGEGYPFDELQYTSLWVGTPLTILCNSIDNMWYFVQSPYSKGWVRSNSVAWMDRGSIKEILQSEKVVVTGDNVRLQGQSSTYKVNTGTILPFDSKSKEIYFPTKSPMENKVIFDRIIRETDMVRDFPIAFNKKNVQQILSQMMGGKYSWGGIDGGRDCSSTLKDYFTVFGIWMPRNSKLQSQNGKANALVNKTIEEKKKTISDLGIPFLSTLYLPGHITLYVGKGANSELLMYHNIWGIKAYHVEPELYKVMKSRERYGLYGLREQEHNQVETRTVIGKTVITDVELEKPLRDIPDLWVKPYLENMEVMTNPGVIEL